MTARQFWHKIYIDPRRKRKMRRWGLPMMDTIDRIMKENGVPYSLAYGTLLGAIREKGFIPHDCDIDMGLWAGFDYSAAFAQMEREGLIKKREISVDDGRIAHEETWWYNGVYVDFFFFYPETDGSGRLYVVEFYPQNDCRNWTESVRKHGGLKPMKCYLPFGMETEYVPFEDRSYAITKDALAFVEECYGPHWRIPDPTFVYPRPGETFYYEMPGKVGVLRKY